MGLIRLLAVILVAYMALRLVTRYVLPWLGRYFIKKATDNMQEQMRRQQDGDKVYQDEKVTIRKSDRTDRAQRKSEDGDDGEYVDYEEV